VTDTWSVDIVAAPALSITKTGDAGPVGIGDTVHYTVTVENTGDIALSNVTVVDAKIGLDELIATLAVGASETFYGSYGPVSESDLPGPIVNTATADSDETGTHSVAIVTAPALSIVKTGDASVMVGNTIQYTITVTNIGDVTLTNVMLTDPLLGLNQNLGTLVPGASITVNPTYGPVTQDEYENSNPLVNTATADSDETGPVTDTHSVIIVSNYKIRVTNTGNITLTNVTVVDAKLGINTNLGSLGVGESQTIQGSYGPVSESDLPGPIVNTATADSDQIGPVSDSHSVPVVTAPGLNIVKTGVPVVKVGEKATYTITVSNSGDVTLYGVWLEDAMLGISQSLGNLAPGESVTVNASYGPVTQWEYENENPLVNTASAYAPEQVGPVYDSHTVIIVSEPQKPTPEPPCIRSDVSVIIYGGWGNTPVKAWVGGTEQTTLYSAATGPCRWRPSSRLGPTRTSGPTS